MRTFIVILVSCASAIGVDVGIQVVTTAKTKAQSGTVSTKDIFTRDGLTNVVRDTKTKFGVVEIRIHRFYHDGLLVGQFTAMPKSSGFTTEAVSSYAIAFELGPSSEVRSAVIGTKDGVVLDLFTCTTGLFSPVDSSLTVKGNAVGADVRELLSPDHVRKASPDDFGREVKKLIEKHKDKFGMNTTQPNPMPHHPAHL